MVLFVFEENCLGIESELF